MKIAFTTRKSLPSKFLGILFSSKNCTNNLQIASALWAAPPLASCRKYFVFARTARVLTLSHRASLGGYSRE